MATTPADTSGVDQTDSRIANFTNGQSDGTSAAPKTIAPQTYHVPPVGLYAQRLPSGNGIATSQRQSMMSTGMAYFAPQPRSTSGED